MIHTVFLYSSLGSTVIPKIWFFLITFEEKLFFILGLIFCCIEAAVLPWYDVFAAVKWELL
jgi:hypothetical protein